MQNIPSGGVDIVKEPAETGYSEKDYSACWKKADLNEMFLGNDLCLADIGLPLNLYFGDNPSTEKILNSLIELTKTSKIYGQYPEKWFYLVLTMLVEISDNLQELCIENFPKIAERSGLKGLGLCGFNYGRYGRDGYSFNRDEGGRLADFDKLVSSMLLFYKSVFKHLPQNPPGSFLDTLMFLQECLSTMTNIALKRKGELELNLREIRAGRFSDYKNFLVPCAAVVHDNWFCKHFDGGLIPASCYLGAFTKFGGAGENDKSALDLLTVRAGMSIERCHSGLSPDRDFDLFDIPDPTGLTNCFYVSVPCSVEEKYSSYAVENLTLLYVTTDAVKRVNPRALGKGKLLVTSDLWGRLVYLTEDIEGQAVDTVTFRPQQVPASLYVARDYESMIRPNPFSVDDRAEALEVRRLKEEC